MCVRAPVFMNVLIMLPAFDWSKVLEREGEAATSPQSL